MVASVLLITDYLLSIGPAIVLTAVTAAFFLTFWAAVPWLRHHWIDEDAENEYEASTGEEVRAGREIDGDR
jgi:hypothetical protein